MIQYMKRISKRSLLAVVLFALLTAMICMANVKKARAYFTTYTAARGGYTIKLGDTTTTDEHYAGGEKIINISNSSDSKAVWVRARAYTGAQYQDLLTYSEKTGASTNAAIGSEGSNWEKSGDWYYYKLPLGPGESTGSFTTSNGNSTYQGLVVNVSGLLTSDLEDDTNINVVIVYETVPVRYTTDGSAEAWTAADWSGEVDSTTVTAN